MSRPQSVKLWAERLQRFEQAQTTVAQFCKAEGVSQPSFYHWKRKLNAADDQVASSLAKFVPVALHAKPDQFDSPHSHTSTTIELPGGIRILIQTPTQAQSVSSSRASS